MYNNFFGLHHVRRQQGSYWELILVTEDYRKSYTIYDDKIINKMRKIIKNYPTLFTKKNWGNDNVKGQSFYINKKEVCNSSQQDLSKLYSQIEKIISKEKHSSTKQ